MEARFPTVRERCQESAAQIENVLEALRCWIYATHKRSYCGLWGYGYKCVCTSPHSGRWIQLFVNAWVTFCYCSDLKPPSKFHVSKTLVVLGVSEIFRGWGLMGSLRSSGCAIEG